MIATSPTIMEEVEAKEIIWIEEEDREVAVVAEICSLQPTRGNHRVEVATSSTAARISSRIEGLIK
jgi:hypothetical protein